MKKLLLLAVSLLILGGLSAETLSDSLDFPFGGREKELEQPDDNAPQTLLGSGNLDSITGFGGPMVTWSKLNGENHVMVGGRGAVVLGDFLVLGGGGMGMVSPLEREKASGIEYTGDYKYIHMGYGGALLGFNFFQKSIINFSLTTLIGGGGLYYSEKWYDEDDDCSDDGDERGDYCEPNSFQEFFVVEPMFLVHMNVTRWFRIGGGISYRYTKGIDNDEFDDEDFRDWSAVIVADFGWF